jgi:hypothetical protein
MFLLNSDSSELTELEKFDAEMLHLQRREVMISKRVMIFQNTMLCFVCQAVLCVLIFEQLIDDPTTSLKSFENILVIITCRFIAGMILHFALYNEVKSAIL